MSIKINTDQNAIDSLLQGLDKGLLKSSLAIQRTSQNFAPLLSGALKSSHKVVRKQKLSYEISANTDYARRRHFENNKNPQTKFYLQRAGDAEFNLIPDTLRNIK